jgi:hypothetical protein
VIAVLDTGPRVHPWLDVTSAGGTYQTSPNDGFVQIDPTMQAAILILGEAADEAGDHDRKPIKTPWDTPETSDPLVGLLEPSVGHCTFISGIVRQVVPNATVLSLRVMHSDDVVNEGELIAALALLAAQVAQAQAGSNSGLMIDAISLSLGYYNELPSDVTYSSGLWKVLEKLLGMGVPVFCAAGNNSRARHFWPAAFATVSAGPGAPPVFSVGALNPNKTRAMFSDDGEWVTAWASGASVVSTFPTDIRGGLMPVEKEQGRETLNPDDFSSGLCVWNGTSFAAPALAAVFLKALLEGAQAAPLTDAAQAATVARAVQALHALGWP